MGALGSFLYNLIVTPLVYVVEIAFSVLYRLVDNKGLAIVGVSLVVNLLCLPLYRMADSLQEEERQRQESMSRWVDHIKKYFKGDEQYMILSTYYRQQNYKPIQALNSSISLLLQIPIFMAAYNYLSGLALLRGTSFLFLNDLGRPDALFTIGGFTVNVLPIAMTLLNCVSTYIYTKGLGLRDKIQAYGLALVFLVLLYNSPSGLVMYWTCNQIFSVVKNVVFKRGASVEEMLSRQPNEQQESPTVPFVLAALLIIVVGGILIPSALISSSVSEFIDQTSVTNPLVYVGYAATVLCGFVLLWVGVFFYLSKTPGRRRFAIVLSIIAFVFLVDYLFFGKNLGIITSSLIYENQPTYPAVELVANIAITAGIVAVLAYVWKHYERMVNPILGITLLATLGLAVPNLVVIQREATKAQAESKNASTIAATEASYIETFFDEQGNIKPLFSLSQDGHNVVVLFMDRAISGYIPYIINEKPELKDALDGFVYYPNTLSYGSFTVFGSPALYGGYDYSVEGMNSRPETLLKDKHDEALQIMPALFSQNGYDVTLLSPPLVSYQYYSSDYSVFEKYSNVNAYNVTYAYADKQFPEYAKINEEGFRRNLCFYSLFKMVPVVLQTPLYDGGRYLSTSVNHTTDEAFIDNYSVMVSLDELTTIDEGDSDNVLIMANCMTHNPDLLQLPNYVPSPYIDNTRYEDQSRFVLDGRAVDMSTERYLMHYHANMAALLRLGEWFDYLREQGVYDNTRIIIVSDHGANYPQFSDMIFDNGELNVEAVNPVLLVKDFDAHGFSTSDDFMTNADTPALAMAGLVENPTNPFTGNPITTDGKNGPQLVTTSQDWHTEHYREDTRFDPEDGGWYTVEGNIFDEKNWKRVDVAQGGN